MSNNETKRLFVALPVEPEMRKKFSELTGILETDNTQVKWVEEENFHLTLKYLGETPLNKVENLIRSIADSLADYSRFEIYLKNIMTFPTMNNPRIICIDVISGSEKLGRVVGTIEDSLEKVGFAKEKRKFRPHLTLGRLKSSLNCDELKNKIQKHREFVGGKMPVNEVHLMQSKLTSKGPIYTVLEKFILM
jgi:RNA 2',3'-cyclic 3'-phosphodiesterase